MPKKTAVYAIRCFKNGKRRRTHALKRKEAAVFKQTAQHLIDYLSSEYGV